MKKIDITTIKKLLLEKYGDSKTELIYKNKYELLVCIILSAQCTDKRVNIITPKLFESYPSIADLAKADIEDVKKIIASCSFFNNKAKNLIKMANSVVDRYGGEIPLIQKELITLEGVGQKTANVLLIEYANENKMAVDTHVFRVSHRLGLSSSSSAIKTEDDLSRLFKTDLDKLHQGMVLFGRYICKSKKPLCQECFLIPYCKSKDRFKPN
mgnify:CR=1 FL=1